MCGIAGIIGEATGAQKLIDAIAHRGPNGIRVEESEAYSLAHARLSIIDLEGGWQPLHAAGSTIIGNGEIYNYVELAEEFQLGPKLSTGSDFEPLLHIYAQEGEAAFDRLRGMYAFCLLDLRDLAEEIMVSFSREQRSALFDALVAACMQAGFSPRLLHVARHPVSMFQMVRQGLGICIVPESFAIMAGEGLQVLRLPAAARPPTFQVKVWPATVPPQLLETKVTPVGRTSVTVTAVAASGPALATVRV